LQVTHPYGVSPHGPPISHEIPINDLDGAVEHVLATGKALALRVDTFNVDVLDGRDLPDWEPDFFKDGAEAARAAKCSNRNGQQ
jgi:hypothetical protein